MSWLDTNKSGGVGRADIDRALASGRSQEAIKAELSRLQGSGYSVGQKALSWGGVSSSPRSTSSSSFDPARAVYSQNKEYQGRTADLINKLENANQANFGVLGLSALERARSSGMSDDDIREGIERGSYKVGEKAFAQLYPWGTGLKTNPMASRTFRDADTGRVSGIYGKMHYKDDQGSWASGKDVEKATQEEFNEWRNIYSRPEYNTPIKQTEEERHIGYLSDQRKKAAYDDWIQKQNADPQSFLNQYLKELV